MEMEKTTIVVVLVIGGMSSRYWAMEARVRERERVTVRMEAQVRERESVSESESVRVFFIYIHTLPELFGNIHTLPD